MVRSNTDNCRAWLLGICAGLMMITNSGCVAALANFIHAIRGNNIPAEFKGLDGKRVAVVCATEQGMNTEQSAIILTDLVRALLVGNLKNPKLVTQHELDAWFRKNTFDQCEFEQIGEGLKADYVVGIDMRNLQLREGSTLYRGHADVTVTVYDMAKGGNAVFRRTLPDFTYPQNAGQPVMDTDESKFRRLYLHQLSNQIGNYFYSHEFGRDVASDARITTLN